MINISFKLVTYAQIHLFQQCGQTYVFVLMKFVWKNSENVPQGLCDSYAENMSTSYNQNRKMFDKVAIHANVQERKERRVGGGDLFNTCPDCLS